MEEREERRISFVLRMLHNQIKVVVHQSGPRPDKRPRTQLQGGILGFLYHHQGEAVYQRDIEKEFRVSRATATNTLQVMEKNGLIVRKSQDKDARLKRIFMTEEAQANHMKVEERMRKLDAGMLRGISEAEAGELYRLLDIIMANLEELQREFAADGAAEADSDGETAAACNAADTAEADSDGENAEADNKKEERK